MSVVSFQAPGADKDGFVAAASLGQVSGVLTEAEFVATYPAPALWVVEAIPEGMDGDESSVMPQLLTIAHQGLEGLRYLDRLAFVAKRPGNPFSLFVSLGRSSSNDIVLGVESVSKVHGFFTWAGGEWYFTDRGSTNGSTLNGEALEASARALLRAGDRLGVGTGVVLEFLTPPALYGRLQRMS